MAATCANSGLHDEGISVYTRETDGVLSASAVGDVAREGSAAGQRGSKTVRAFTFQPQPYAKLPIEATRRHPDSTHPQLEAASKTGDLGAGEARAYFSALFHHPGCDRRGACAIGYHPWARETGPIRHPRRRTKTHCSQTGQELCTGPSTHDGSESVHISFGYVFFSAVPVFCENRTEAVFRREPVFQFVALEARSRVV